MDTTWQAWGREIVWAATLAWAVLTVLSLLWLAADTAGRGRGWYSALFLALAAQQPALLALAHLARGGWWGWVAAALLGCGAALSVRLAFGRFAWRLLLRRRRTAPASDDPAAARLRPDPAPG